MRFVREAASFRFRRREQATHRVFRATSLPSLEHQRSDERTVRTERAVAVIAIMSVLITAWPNTIDGGRAAGHCP